MFIVGKNLDKESSNQSIEGGSADF